MSSPEDHKDPTTPTTPKQQYTSLSSLLLPDGSPSRQSPKRGDLPDARGRRSTSIGWKIPGMNEQESPQDATERGILRSAGDDPSARPQHSPSRSRSSSPDDSRAEAAKHAGSKGRLSTLKMMALTVSMGGSQIAWTVELGYGTPYLLSLGLSEQLTSLVWLAGPISGLVAQPLIGAISDSSQSRFRRRYWIVAATVLLVISGLGLAFTEAIARGLVDIGGGGEGDWDPRRAKLIKSTAIGIAVLAFYCLDFALNALQASLRNLVLDITPGEQLASANAWHGRFNHFGNIVGFTLGFLNLSQVPVIRLVGGGQFRKVCIVALIFLVITVWITCWTQEEDAKESIFGERRSKIRDVIATIYDAVLHLPKPVRRVCYVQIAAFMGWFPYLFYSTTWVGEVMATELGYEPDVDRATRAGSLALLIYSFVAIFAGTLLPYLAARDHRLLKPETKRRRAAASDASDGEYSTDDEDDEELENIRDMVRGWKAEAARDGRPLKLPTMPFMLRNIWTAALVLFAVIMASTFFITKVWQATVAIALVGICWAVACWVPFAIIMEFLKEMDDQHSASTKTSSTSSRRARPPPYTPHTAGASSSYRPMHSRAMSTPTGAWHSTPASPTPNERTPLARSMSTADVEGAYGDRVDYTGSGPVAGGTIMGIHNLAIVFPQFIIAVVASIIFKIADGDAPPSGGLQEGDRHIPKTGVAWVLRFGGLMALVGAAISRRVPPTKTEKAMRRRLAEMREESAE